jgi:heme exporter protein C
LILPRLASPNLAFALVALGFVLLLAGSYYGLFVSPQERYMGDVQRIMYVHVPSAWNALLLFTLAMGCALAYLWRGGWGWDAHHEALLEGAAVLSFLLCVQGSIWAKPTWGVWWDWDPRLTTTAVMLLALLGILALRSAVDDPEKRATWSAVATIIAFVDVPIVYFSVRWWNSLHQMQSSPETVSAPFIVPLRLNAFGVLALMGGLALLRARIAARRTAKELGPALPPLPASAAVEA